MDQNRLESDDINTMSYSVAFLQAAKRLSDFDFSDRHLHVLPFYTLIGFSIENGFKTFLEHTQADKALKWERSHDLSSLRELATKHGLPLIDDQIEFVDQLSPHHADFRFRYPQKAGGKTEVYHPHIAICLTENILRTVFEKIGGIDRLADL